MKIFGREPALWIATISAVLGIIVTFGWSGLDATDATNIVAVITAAGGVVTAVMTRPIAISAFTTLAGSVFILLAGYGLDASQQLIGAVQLAVVAVGALIARGQIFPVASPPPDTEPALTSSAHRLDNRY